MSWLRDNLLAGLLVSGSIFTAAVTVIAAEMDAGLKMELSKEDREIRRNLQKVTTDQAVLTQRLKILINQNKEDHESFQGIMERMDAKMDTLLIRSNNN